MSKLKSIREQLNLTQEELSVQSGISVRTIQRIESGTSPKGYTLKTLANTLKISENELLNSPVDVDTIVEIQENLDIQKIKIINLSSILFIVLPPLNIIIPLILSYFFKQNNYITNQVISLQIMWTLLSPVVFILGIFLKLGNNFTIFLMSGIVLSNAFLILRNLAELDRKQKLHFKLNFNIL